MFENKLLKYMIKIKVFDSIQLVGQYLFIAQKIQFTFKANPIINVNHCPETNLFYLIRSFSQYHLIFNF